MIVATLCTRPERVNQALFSSSPQHDRIALSVPLYFFASIVESGDAYGPGRNFVSFVGPAELDSLRRVYRLDGYPNVSHDTAFVRLVDNGAANGRDASSAPNVVLVQMEGMSALFMERFGRRAGLTPFLDSLYAHSLAFTDCYSIGPRTNFGMCGIYASWPTFLDHHAILCNFQYPGKGLSQHLHEAGYRNLFFLTHDLSFDGLTYFLPTLGYDEIYSEKDYPKEKIVSVWGVNDRTLFDNALDVLTRRDSLSPSQPFFASIMTISNHPPYVLPADFRARSEEEELQGIEYADAELARFYREAQRRPWFDRTVFVFVADHGLIFAPPETELPEELNHIPLLVVGPGIEPELHTGLTSQMDVMAIVLGRLGLSYWCDNFSIDVLSHPRRYVVYSSQTCFACRSDDRLYIYDMAAGQDACYLHSQGNYTRVAADDEFQNMREYLFMVYQMADNMSLPYRR